MCLLRHRVDLLADELGECQGICLPYDDRKSELQSTISPTSYWPSAQTYSCTSPGIIHVTNERHNPLALQRATMLHAWGWQKSSLVSAK